MIKIVLGSMLFMMAISSCNSTDKHVTPNNSISVGTEEKVVLDAFIPDTLRTFDGAPNDILKGAMIKTPILKIKLFHFSNSESKDTFKLEIPKGLIEYSNSTVSITNSSGQVIYALVFPTFYLKDGYEFIPDIPTNLDSVQTRIFLENHEKTLTKKVYEKHYLEKIDAFLTECAFEAEKDDYFLDAEYVLNNEVRTEVLKYEKLICVSFPIMDGEEGTSFIAYSKKKSRAFVFAETD